MNIYNPNFTNSKFADWLRGTPKPFSASAEGWKKWEQEAQAKHPIRYWITETGLEAIEDLISFLPKKFDAVRNYIRNRYIKKTHALVADPKYIKPGEYYDYGYKIIPCLFSGLVDFVECEKAWMHIVFSEENAKKYAPRWARTRTLRWKQWRCPEAGLANLEWEMTLVHDESAGFAPDDPKYGKPTQQAITAKEVIELYTWFKEVYSKRRDPYEYIENDAGELTTNDNIPFVLSDNPPKEVVETFKQQQKTMHEIQDKYDQEDTEMLIRLIKIRQDLWT